MSLSLSSLEVYEASQAEAGTYGGTGTGSGRRVPRRWGRSEHVDGAGVRSRCRDYHSECKEGVPTPARM